jgi:ABC-type phosphate transport system substrate-binding protein
MVLISRLGSVALGIALSLGSATATADVVAIVSSASPITAVTKGQIADIFMGKIRRLPNGAAALPIDQIEGSSAREEFYTKVVGKSGAQMKAYWSRIIFTGRGQPPKEMSTSEDVKKLVVSNPAAIGYIDEKLVDSSVRVLP